MGLLSSTELAAIREVAELGMTSTAIILRKTRVATSEGSEETFAPVGTTKGWIVETQSQAITEVGGIQSVVMVFDFRVPVGTDILPFDKVSIAGEVFNVSDTDAEGTILPYITCRLRRAD